MCYWLIPRSHSKNLWRGKIEELARQYNAPLFEPHVTVFVSGTDQESVREQMENAVRGIQSFSLKVKGFNFTDQFTKSFFIEFESSPTLTQISETLKRGSPVPSAYELFPHMSLLYHTLSFEEREKWRATFSIPEKEIFFDELVAVLVPSLNQNKNDVESWEEVYRFKLRS